MYLISLGLENFRNYALETFSFHPRLNIFTGKNAQGKTNILEAIHYLGYLGSFRQSKREELIRKGSNEAVIKAFFDDEECRHEIRIFLKPRSKSMRVDGKRSEKPGSIIPVLLFEPHDVYLFRDTPSARRHSLDRALVLDNPACLRLQKDYEEVVSHKNRLLKEGNPARFDDELSVWNEKLARLGACIIRHRLLWIEKLNRQISCEYRKVSGGSEELVSVYRCCIPAITGLDGQMTEELIFDLLGRIICEKKPEEIARKESVIGPHRDDWTLLIDGKPLGLMGSQGENRSAVIALKMAQVYMYEKEHGRFPVFLLDDVASELDKERAAKLLSCLRSLKGQVFLTTTKHADISGHFGAEGASFLVEAGKVHMLVGC